MMLNSSTNPVDFELIPESPLRNRQESSASFHTSRFTSSNSDGLRANLLQPDSPSSEEHRDDTGELLSPLRRELRPRAERAESTIFWLCAIFGYLGVMLYAIKSNCDADCKSHLNYGVLLNNKHKWRWFAEYALLYFTVPSVTILALLLIWALARRRTLKFWMLIRAIRRVEDWRDIPQVY